MKRILIIAIVLDVLVVGITFVISDQKVIRNEPFETGVAIYRYDKQNIEIPLSPNDLSVVSKMFIGKKTFKDNLSCGFSENISIKVDDSKTFCIACDSCPKIYWKEKDCYFSLTNSEIKELHTMLEQYGFVFPCV